MEVKDVAVPKGTTHLVSKEDFCRIVNFKEPEDLLNHYATYEVEYVVATRGGGDLPVTRSFMSNGAEGCGGFIELLKSVGVKILREGEEKVLIIPSQEDFILPRLVGMDGKIIDMAMEGIS